MAEEKTDETIEVHTIETDMQALGINTGESTEVESKDAENTDEESQEVEEQKETEDGGDDTPTEDDPAPTKRKRKSRSQRRIEKLARENNRLEEKLKEVEGKDTPSEVDIDDYDSYDEYLDAVKKQDTEDKPEDKNVEVPKIDNVTFNEAVEDGKEDYKDFEKVVFSDDLPLTEETLAEVLTLDEASDVLYYLGTHKEVAADIAGLSGKKMILEIGKIEERLASGKKKTAKVTKAPEPINPVKGVSSSKVDVYDTDTTQEQHDAFVAAQQASTRGGFL